MFDYLINILNKYDYSEELIRYLTNLIDKENCIGIESFTTELAEISINEIDTY